MPGRGKGMHPGDFAPLCFRPLMDSGVKLTSINLFTGERAKLEAEAYGAHRRKPDRVGNILLSGSSHGLMHFQECPWTGAPIPSFRKKWTPSFQDDFRAGACIVMSLNEQHALNIGF